VAHRPARHGGRNCGADARRRNVRCRVVTVVGGGVDDHTRVAGDVRAAGSAPRHRRALSNVVVVIIVVIIVIVVGAAVCCASRCAGGVALPARLHGGGAPLVRLPRAIVQIVIEIVIIVVVVVVVVFETDGSAACVGIAISDAQHVS
jgi:hypothetical protein